MQLTLSSPGECTKESFPPLERSHYSIVRLKIIVVLGKQFVFLELQNEHFTTQPTIIQVHTQSCKNDIRNSL